MLGTATLLLLIGLLVAVGLVLRAAEILTAADGRHTSPRVVGAVAIFTIAAALLLSAALVLAWWGAF